MAKAFLEFVIPMTCSILLPVDHIKKEGWDVIWTQCTLVSWPESITWNIISFLSLLLILGPKHFSARARVLMCADCELWSVGGFWSVSSEVNNNW